MDPINNCLSDSKRNMLILLMTLLVVLQAVICLFTYKIKENSYVATNHALGYVGGNDKAVR
ncbi:MAG: hypothetical protein NTU89_00070 [Candidatus Dependentiae bacterium]|nr:hypothetical protein [Candidatus Dependentiae bacterium]